MMVGAKTRQVIRLKWFKKYFTSGQRMHMIVLVYFYTCRKCNNFETCAILHRCYMLNISRIAGIHLYILK